MRKVSGRRKHEKLEFLKTERCATLFTQIHSQQVSETTLLLARDVEFRSVLKRINVYDEIEDDENPLEGRIFTGYVIPPVSFQRTVG